MVTLWKDVNFTNLYLPFTKWIEFFIPLVCFSFFLPFFAHHHAFSFWWEDYGFLVFSAVLQQFFLYLPIHLGFLLKNAGKIAFHIQKVQNNGVILQLYLKTKRDCQIQDQTIKYNNRHYNVKTTVCQKTTVIPWQWRTSENFTASLWVYGNIIFEGLLNHLKWYWYSY